MNHVASNSGSDLIVVDLFLIDLIKISRSLLRSVLISNNDLQMILTMISVNMYQC